MKNAARKSTSVILLLAMVTALCARAATADERIPYQSLIDQKGPSLVTIKYTLKVGAQGGQDQEIENETTGVMISADGLVLCSNTQLGGIFSMMGGAMRGRGRELRVTPKDFKVLAGGDAQGLAAKLIARDTDLDLAWVKINEPKDKKFEFIDFGKAKEPKLGDDLLWIRRLAKYYDRAPVVSDAKLGGIVKKPRIYYLTSDTVGQGASAFGLPVFAADGSIVGLTVLHANNDEGDSDSASGMMSAMMGGAGEGMILPAAEIVKATKRAQESTPKDE